MKPTLPALLLALFLFACSSEEPPAPAPVAGDLTFQAFDTAPTPTRTVDPGYPEEARRAGVTGTVHVEVVIDASGSVRETRVARSSGNDALDAAARRAAGEWEFSPALLEGRAVAARIVLPVRFALE